MTEEKYIGFRGHTTTVEEAFEHESNNPMSAIEAYLGEPVIRVKVDTPGDYYSVCLNQDDAWKTAPHTVKWGKQDHWVYIPLSECTQADQSEYERMLYDAIEDLAIQICAKEVNADMGRASWRAQFLNRSSKSVEISGVRGFTGSYFKFHAWFNHGINIDLMADLDVKAIAERVKERWVELFYGSAESYTESRDVAEFRYVFTDCELAHNELRTAYGYNKKSLEELTSLRDDQDFLIDWAMGVDDDVLTSCGFIPEKIREKYADRL